MTNIRYFGNITSVADHRKKVVTFRVRRDPRKATQLTHSEMRNVAAWALAGVANFEKEGYSIDNSAILKYLNGDSGKV